MTQNGSFKDTVLFILGSFVSSVVLLAFIFPHLWFCHNIRLYPEHDRVCPFESTYILVSHFFHGGVQLWDRFDQMNNAYFVLSNGVYSAVNVLTAFIFVILSPFSSRPGEDLYHIHLIFFYGLNCLFRTIGGYVLLRRMVTHRGAIFVTLLYLNTVLTSYMMKPGIITQVLYSSMPLLLYFILCFFEECRLRSFLMAALVMALCFVSTPLFTLGYFYQAVHFFIISCGIFFIYQRGWLKLRRRPSMPKGEIFRNIGLLICCLLIVLPYLWWAGSLRHDFYLYGSGLGGTQGRFNNIFNLSKYFTVQGKSFSNPLEFLGSSLDYYHNVWGSSWLFIGGSSLSFALAGTVLSRDKRKYIFVATVFFVVLINTACFPGNIYVLGRFLDAVFHNPPVIQGHFNDLLLYTWLTVSSVAHGINAMTNPLSFLVRSFHMTSLLISMLILPLVAMGIESCIYVWQGQKELIHFKRRWLLLLFFAVVILWAISGGIRSLGMYNPDAGGIEGVKEYTLFVATVFFIFFLTSFFCSLEKKRIGWILAGSILMIELTALKTYVRSEAPDTIVPVRIGQAYTRQAIVPDYQNPEILPFREFMNADRSQVHPCYYVPQGMYGAFYQYAPIGRFFYPWDLYTPRHISYRDLYPDLEIQQYLSDNPRTVFFADDAFDSRYLALADILRLNLGARVVTVERDENNKPFLKTAERVYITPQGRDDRFFDGSLEWGKAQLFRRRYGLEYTFDLPREFPAYLATTVFTNDQASWRMEASGRVLEPMQGELSAPYTYDVQNIQEKKITVLLPDGFVPQADIKLQVRLPDRILNVWKNNYDDLGFTYLAPKAGWLVFNYPYDEKWDLTIDGRNTPLSKVNRYFIGAPMSGGEHQVCLRYWPHTSLRFWIFISMALSTVCFLGIMFYSIKREPLYQV